MDAPSSRRALNNKNIDITDKHGKVSDPNAKVSKQNDQATWQSLGDEFWIFFGTPAGSTNYEPGSPFKAGYMFYVPPYGSVSSGPVTQGAKVGGKYKYTVVGPDGITDPVIIIDQ